MFVSAQYVYVFSDALSSAESYVADQPLFLVYFSIRIVYSFVESELFLEFAVLALYSQQ